MQKIIHIFSLIIYCATLYAQAPTACYPFNDNTIDRMTGIPATISGGQQGVYTTTDRFGNPFGAIRLNADYGGSLRLGKTANLKPTTGTLSIWANVASTHNWSGQCGCYTIINMISHNSAGLAIGGITVRYSGINKSASFGYFCSVIDPVYTNPADTLTTRAWHHFVVTYTPTEANFYLDNVHKGTVIPRPNCPPTIDTTSYVIIGYEPSAYAFADIKVDDYRVYDRVLSPSQIGELYRMPAGASCFTVDTENAVDNNAVKVSPNPTTGNLHLTHTEGTALKYYTIADISGKIIAQNAMIPNDNELHLDLANGVYFLMITDMEGLISKHKVVVVR